MAVWSPPAQVGLSAAASTSDKDADLEGQPKKRQWQFQIA
jgi:hypothetical protein